MMYRREWLARFALMPAALVPVRCLSAPSDHGQYGLVTVESHKAHRERTGEFLRVSVDGVDVTRQCFEACDTPQRSYALVYCADEEHHSDWHKQDGLRHVKGPNKSAICTMELRGDIRIAPGASY